MIVVEHAAKPLPALNRAVNTVVVGILRSDQLSIKVWVAKSNSALKSTKPWLTLSPSP